MREIDTAKSMLRQMKPLQALRASEPNRFSRLDLLTQRQTFDEKEVPVRRLVNARVHNCVLCRFMAIQANQNAVELLPKVVSNVHVCVSTEYVRQR